VQAQPTSHVANDHSNKPTNMPSAKSAMKRAKFMVIELVDAHW